MPGDSGVTVVTTLVCFLFCTRGCGRIERPAFPAPSEFRGQNAQGKTRADARRDRGSVARVCFAAPRWGGGAASSGQRSGSVRGGAGEGGSPQTRTRG